MLLPFQQRTYSEDEEVDLSAGSMTSVTSVGSVDSDGSREFMDVLQVRQADDHPMPCHARPCIPAACCCKDSRPGQQLMLSCSCSKY